MYKTKRSIACDIPLNVKKKVWERDCHRCIYCGVSEAMPNAHFIPRSKGGLGIEENIVTLCISCHRNYDQTDMRIYMREYIANYLRRQYPDWDNTNLVYDRWGDGEILNRRYKATDEQTRELE